MSLYKSFLLVSHKLRARNPNKSAGKQEPWCYLVHIEQKTVKQLLQEGCESVLSSAIRSPTGQQPATAAGARWRARLSASPFRPSGSHSRTLGLNCFSPPLPCLFLSLLSSACLVSEDAAERTPIWVASISSRHNRCISGGRKKESSDST